MGIAVLNRYPEVTNEQASMAILKKYESELTYIQYQLVSYAVSTNAHEGLYCNEDDIILLVKIAKGELDGNDVIKDFLTQVKQAKEDGMIS